ncbi:MAG: ElyC/SanA/YdcF family protein [Campylobacterota bacterium]|nr:ElyC/SanA/YdcF family protein [Campylobacterota bacterium]
MSIAFTLKKIISGLIMPLSIGFIFAFIGLYFLYKNSYKKAKIFLTICIVWIAIIAYSPFSNFLLEPLESKYSKLEKIPQDIKYILLLGGDQKSRGWEALRLYNKIPNSKIITSGYEGRYDIPEAIKTANILVELGIPKKDIIIHSKPKDTKEEAIKIKSILKDEPFILITSHYHMPRAIALFNKEGLYPIAAPTDKLAKENKYLSIPSGGDLKKTEIAMHEYIGLLWSKLRGQI